MIIKHVAPTCVTNSVRLVGIINEICSSKNGRIGQPKNFLIEMCVQLMCTTLKMAVC
jgi:hypothetical protein